MLAYQNLNPMIIINAIESLGYLCNGSLLALNSYENRVYQVGLEDTLPIVAKFYRPERWSDEAILEEHQYAQELLAQDIPIVAPIVINDKSLHRFQEFRFAIFPRWGGRILELDNLEHLEWMGRYIGRVHAVGACKKFNYRRQFSIEM